MKVLLLAPGAHPPFTEGRKRFVIDLAGELKRRGFDTVAVAGREGHHGIALLLQTMFCLLLCLLGRRPQAAVIFPYGRFRGVRGLANLSFTALAKVMLWVARVPCLVLFYSVDGISIATLAKIFRRVGAIGHGYEPVKFIHLGLGETMPLRHKNESSVRRLLFLCGYQKGGLESLNGVLYERGLDLLFRALGLADSDFSLTVAIPFLRDATARNRLEQLARELCPKQQISWLDSGDPRTLLATHDAFVFPYIADHEVFIPTSMLEAMTIGTPVIATDMRMYQSLTKTEAHRCFLAEAVTAESLRDAIDACFSRLDYAFDRAERSRQAVLIEWNMRKAVEDVLHALDLS